MTSPINEVKFVNKAVSTSPKYLRVELLALQKSGAKDMVQIPGIYLKGIGNEMEACKVVLGINKNGNLMNGSEDVAVWPCPPVCRPPKPVGLVTLSNFLK